MDLRKDLQDPIDFPCGLSAKNRLVLAPLTNTQSFEDGTLSPEELRWLARRAKGGFGTLISCATHVSRHGQGWPRELGSFSDAHMGGLSQIAEMARAHDSRSIIQIFHCGARSPSALTGEQPRSASEFHLDLPGFEKPRAMSEAEIEDVIEDFGRAAARVRKAGCDGVEVHGANGYLITQFLSKHSNLRHDSWGGTAEKRSRFLKEIFAQVRGALGPDKILGVRISPEDTPTLGGLDIDEMLEVASWLKENGADYIHLSLWEARKFSLKYGEAKAPIVRQFRERLGADIPLIVAGKIWTREEALSILELGASMIALGAAAIANPDWPRKVSADPKFQPDRFPMTRAQFAERDVSPHFVDYLRARKWVSD